MSKTVNHISQVAEKLAIAALDHGVIYSIKNISLKKSDSLSFSIPYLMVGPLRFSQMCYCHIMQVLVGHMVETEWCNFSVIYRSNYTLQQLSWTSDSYKQMELPFPLGVRNYLLQEMKKSLPLRRQSPLEMKPKTAGFTYEI